MAWTNLTFVQCSILTAGKMTQLQANFAALAGGAADAPAITVNSLLWTGQGSGAALHVSSGISAPEISSMGTLHVASGVVAPQVSSFGMVYAGSGFSAPQVSSFGTINVESGFARVEATSGFIAAVVSSLANLEVSSAMHVAGSPSGTPVSNTLYKNNIPKAWINFDGTGTISIRDTFNVSSITDDGIGKYTVTWDQDFADVNYALAASSNGSLHTLVGTYAVGSVQVTTTDQATTTTDYSIITAIAFGNQS